MTITDETTEDQDTQDTDAEGTEGSPFSLEDLLSSVGKLNLCDALTNERLTQIGREVCEGYKIDKESRSEWAKTYTEAMKLAQQVKEQKDYPWPNAANIKYPLVTTAAIQFAARAYPAIVDGFSVVKGKVLGPANDQKQALADRIAAHMSWQLIEKMPEWEGETDQMLHMLPIVGSVFRKVWYDPIQRRNRSEIILPDKLVCDYWAKADPPRMTHECEFYPNDIQVRFNTKVWRKVEIGREGKNSEDDQSPHEFLEQHRLLDLDDDGYAEPYIVTVHRETEQVVRITARYYQDGIIADRDKVIEITPCQHFTHYTFMPSFDGSFLGVGFGALLASLSDTVNGLANQLLDAGHLSNVQGGFIGNDIKMKGGVHAFRPGEWKRVDVSGASLSNNVMPLPTQQPSAVLFNLLNMLIEASKDITATKDILTGETQGSNQAVGTTLAMIEQGLKVFTAIYKRIHRALRAELNIYFDLNSRYLDDREYFEFQDMPEGGGTIGREDYKREGLDVVPMSDPSMVTDMQKMARAQFLMQFLNAGLDDMEIKKRVLTAAGIADVQGLFPKQAPPPPPEFILKAHELEIKDRETSVKEKQAEISEYQAYADIALKDATTRKTLVEALMTDPEAMQFLSELIASNMQAMKREVAQIVEPMENEQHEDTNQPGGVPSVAGEPGNAGGNEVPGGLPGEPQGAMGGGNGPEQSDAGPGGEPGGSDQPLA